MESNVAIALPEDAELARAVITRGRRLAHSLGVGWIAVRILPRGNDRTDLTPFVDACGGRLVVAHDSDVAKSIIEICSRERTRLLVIGRSRRPRFLRRLVRGTTEKLLRASRSFDVVIAGGDEA